MKILRSDKDPRPSAEHRRPDEPPLPRLRISHEQRPDLGEDAGPIWVLVPPDHGLIGVFDGLGGAGGEQVKMRDGRERSGAWVASRLAYNIAIEVYRAFVAHTQGIGSAGVDELYDEVTVFPELDEPYDFTGQLQRNLQENFVKAAAGYGSGGGLLKSRLIKMLPTTLAICAYDLGTNEATAVWAGDSRVYQLGPNVGLQQLTTDDLKSNADALENLTQDSPMSNCVSADTDFVLHERRLPLPPQTILIAASDGCFGYVHTPLHFEYMLLSTMQESTSWMGWEVRLKAAIQRVTSDDSTLSAVAIGWTDFAACKRAFVPRYRWCAQRHKTYDDQRLRVAALDLDLEQARADLAVGTKALWENYRVTYESLAKGPTRDVPARRVDDAPADGGSAK